MPLYVRVQIDKRQRQALERALRNVRNRIPEVLSWAVRRTADMVRSRIVKAITADLKVKAKDLYQRGNRRRPVSVIFSGLGKYKDGAVIVVSSGEGQGGIEQHTSPGGRIPLGAFAARQTRPGVSYQIARAGGRKMIPGTFIPQLESGHRGVFRRKPGIGQWSWGAPMSELFGPSIPHVALKRPKIQRLLRTQTRDLFAQNLGSRTDLMLERIARRG